MGTVDEVRKVIQDLVAPDLKALDVRLNALEAKIDLKFKHVETEIEIRFKASEEMAKLRHETILNVISANNSQILQALSFDKRLANLESKQLSSGPEQHV